MSNIDYSKQGKRAKRKGYQYEANCRDCINEFWGRKVVMRTPRSGGFARFPSDLLVTDKTTILNNFNFECKHQKKIHLKQWLKQAEEDAEVGKTALVMFRWDNASNNYVALKREDFLNLLYELEELRGGKNGN